ncbi:hypothetical protein [Kineococcus gypseus]|uniref:hypothetical protein n=1 Tax=Kineococcus gypseus TaxID=1637102 RepID=UPI003D7E5500
MPVQEPPATPVAPPVATGDGSTPSAPPAFVAELSERVQQTRATIECATAAGEDELAAAHLGELEGLVDLAAAHDVALPDAVAYLAGRADGADGAEDPRARDGGSRPAVVDLTALARRVPAACAAPA